VFAGFSSGSLVDRINDSGCKVVLTSDGAFRGDKGINLKNIVDEALEKCPTIEKTVVVKHTNGNVNMKPSRDAWWSDVVSKQNNTCDAEEMDSEDLLFILYTSGSTGKPKGMVHTPAPVTWCTSITLLRQRFNTRMDRSIGVPRTWVG